MTKIEPVGRWFEAYCSRRRHKHTLSHHSLHSSSSEESEGELSEEEEEDEELLKTLDPKDWKVHVIDQYNIYFKDVKMFSMNG